MNEKLKNEVQNVINEMAGLFLDLADRWEEEKQFEVFISYKEALRECFNDISSRFYFYDATSDPFTMEFRGGIHKIIMKAIPDGIESTIEVIK